MFVVFEEITSYLDFAMTRHGKNCTAGAVYTYHEKKKDTGEETKCATVLVNTRQTAKNNNQKQSVVLFLFASLPFFSDLNVFLGTDAFILQ